MPKKTPSELRDLAKRLMNRAAEEEEKRYARIGRVIDKYLNNGFEGFDINIFKKEVTEAAKR